MKRPLAILAVGVLFAARPAAAQTPPPLASNEPLVAPVPPPRPFRRTGVGWLAEMAAGAAVTVPTAYLFNHYPRSLQVPDLGGAMIGISLITAMSVGSAMAVGAAGRAVDGPRASSWGPALGLGVGTLVGLMAGVGFSDSAYDSSSSSAELYAVFLTTTLGAVVGYNLAADTDSERLDAGVWRRRKLSLMGVLGGDTLGGGGLEVGFQVAPAFAVALQAISGDLGGFEGALPLRLYPAVGWHHALYVAAGPHLTVAPLASAVIQAIPSTGTALGVIGAVGWDYRGDSGFSAGVELSLVHEPDAGRLAQVDIGPNYVGGLLRVGYAR